MKNGNDVADMIFAQQALESDPRGATASLLWDSAW